MGYASVDDVREAVGGTANLVELSDLENTGAVDTAAVESAIRKADGVIDSYTAKRYGVPLATQHATSVRDRSADMAARFLRRRRYKGQPIPDDQVQEEIDRKWLEGIADGMISLGVDPPPPKSSIVVDKAALRDTTLAVSKENMKGFI